MSDDFNFDPNDVDLRSLITDGFGDVDSSALGALQYMPVGDGFGDADSSALGALRYMPVEQQQRLLDEFFQTEAGQALTSEERIGLQNAIYGQSDAETARLQRQAGNEGDGSLKAKGVPVGNPNDPMGIKKLADISGDGKGILGTGISGSDLAKYGLLAGIAKMAYDDAAKARKEARGVTATGGYAEQVTRTPSGSKKLKKVAMGGGIGSLEMARGGRTLPPRYLDGHSDGMEDKIPANIDGRRPAALSDGEFVIPADVVSHLGNGNSNAGAKRLYEMMDRIRTARTGNHKQGKQINPDKFMPR